jgi:hypothetical protein
VFEEDIKEEEIQEGEEEVLGDITDLIDIEEEVVLVLILAVILIKEERIINIEIAKEINTIHQNENMIDTGIRIKS